MNIKEYTLEAIQKKYPNSTIIPLERVNFKDFQIVKNLDDLINNSTLVGHFFEEIESDQYEVLYDLVDRFLDLTDSTRNKDEKDSEYDYFEDDFINFISSSNLNEAKTIMKGIGGDQKFSRVAIISLNYNIAYLTTDRKQIDIPDLFPKLKVLYEKFLEKIDKEM